MVSNRHREIRVDCRWASMRLDLDRILEIENAVFEFPWRRHDFSRTCRQRNVCPVVAEYKSEVVGFLFYGLHVAERVLHIMNLAVHPDYQRLGVGSQMLARLLGKLSPSRYHIIELEVRETNVPAQLFFRENGFRAVQILRGFYDETSEDAYVMKHWKPEIFFALRQSRFPALYIPS